MSGPALVLPVIVQALMTFALLYWMGAVRTRATASREVHIRQIALGQPAWPDRVTQISNAYHNQLQLPLLFYAVAAFALIAGKADTVMVALAWGFVALRLVHAWIHTTSNHVPRRFYAFFAGSVVLLAMWLWLGLRVLAGGG